MNLRILAVDCADKSASCSVVEDGRELCGSFVRVGLTHSRTLMPMLVSMLKNSEITVDSIDRLVITHGPGSFTGLRIGIAAVKGLAFAKDIPCAGVSTLHASAKGCDGFDGVICPVMDARCSQFYNALFSAKEGKLTRLCDDRAIMADELKLELLRIKDRVIITGPGAEAFYATLGEERGNVTLAPEPLRPVRAQYAALISDEYECVPPAKLMPQYLRLPQAERELKQKRGLE